MARVNKCRICGSTDPESGWAGANHSLCNGCVPAVQAEKRTRRTEKTPTRETSWPHSRFAPLMAAALCAAVLEKNNGN